ncbi:MAG TPA: YfhO family protein [Rhodocyclaceae bacterium]|nr:YfhO family protein [Rhodocyclaceae bacterium]
MTPHALSFRQISMKTKVAIAFFFAATAFFILSDFLLFQKVFYYFDFEVQWIPFHQFVHAAWKSGQSALWDPFIMLGFPQHAEGQVGVFYPINLLLHWLPNQPYTIALSIYIHVVLGLISTYLLARACQLRRLASVHAAICFAFSGFIFAQLTNYNISLVAVYLPLKLLFITYYFDRRGTQHLLYFALVTASELLVSHANMSFITSTAAGLYFLLCALAKREHFTRDVGLFGLSYFLALSIAAIQLLPTFELLTQSDRSAGISYDMVTSYSLSFSEYLTAFFPLMFGSSSTAFTSGSSFEEKYFFVGSVGMLLALFGVAALVKRRDNKFIAIIALLGVVGLILSLGGNNPFFDLYRLLIHVPGFNFFRAPARWSLVLTLAAAILSGYGLQILLENFQCGKTLKALAWLIALAICAPLMVYALGWKDTEVQRSILWGKIIHPLAVDLSNLAGIDHYFYSVFTLLSPLAYYVAILLALAVIATIRLPARYAGLAILVLGMVDIFMVIKPINPRMPADFFANTPPHIVSLKQQIGIFRATSNDDIPNLSSVNNSVGAFYGVQSIKGYSALQLKNYIALRDQLQRPDIQDYVGVKYEIVPGNDSQFRIVERPGAFPRAFLLPRYSTYEDDSAAFAAFLKQDEMDRKSVATLSMYSVHLLGLAAHPQASTDDTFVEQSAAVNITDYENSRVEMRGETRQPAFLIITDIYYPGWKARVNGQAAPLVPIHGTFRGIYLKHPGAFTVEMTYEPMSFEWGMWLSLSGLTVAVLLAFGLHKATKNQTKPRESARRE